MATFSNLPYELRAQIWEMTVEPRTINVNIRRETHGARRSYVQSTTPVPAILQVCREARNYGLYQKVFSEVATPGKGAQYVWANLESDIIDIGTSYLVAYTLVASQIRKLKIDREISASYEGEFFYHWENDELRKFTNLEEIHVVCVDGVCAWLRALEEIYWPCGDDNVFFIDGDDPDLVFRGEDGIEQIAAYQESTFM